MKKNKLIPYKRNVQIGWTCLLREKYRKPALQKQTTNKKKYKKILVEKLKFLLEN